MSVSALIFMISVQATVTVLTVYFFVKLLVIDKKKNQKLDNESL